MTELFDNPFYLRQEILSGNMQCPGDKICDSGAATMSDKADEATQEVLREFSDGAGSATTCLRGAHLIVGFTCEISPGSGECSPRLTRREVRPLPPELFGAED